LTQDNPTFIILTPGFAASEEDGNCLPMQQHLVRTINQIHPGLNVVVLAFQYPYHHSVYYWFDNVIFSFNGKNKGGLNKLLLRRKLQKVLQELGRRSAITGLLSFWYGECALVGKTFSGRSGVPHYCWILGQDAGKDNKYPENLKLDGKELIALSDFLQEEFERNHSVRPSVVIPPGIDINDFENGERSVDIAGAGSLIPLKQFDAWLEVVAQLKTSIPGIRAVLAGDGPEKKKLQEMARQLGVSENIEIRGELPHSEVLQLLKRTKLLLHPSAYEGFSGVCQEALACGAHVISFTRAMNHEIPDWHVVQNKEEMIGRAKEILQHPGIHFQPSSQFSMKETAKKILALFPDIK
jgi:glycosyltransferase involved in cell wall biosynthesis